MPHHTFNKSRASQQGFTLIEIAVVLVIVGLLIGGIMKGQDMIGSAKVKNLGQDLRSVGTYAMAYQDKFRALPGDDSAAAAHVNGTSATTGGTAGNGLIEGAWDSTTKTDESFLFWEHVRLAGIAAGSTDKTAAEYIPKNANGGPIGVTSTNPTSGTWSASLYACTSNVTGAMARQLDTTLDDGNTASGSLRVAGTNTALTPANDGTNYTVCMAF